MGIALAESKRMNCACRGWPWHTSCTWRLRPKDIRDGTHALELAFAAMSGIDWKKR